MVAKCKKALLLLLRQLDFTVSP